MNQSTKIILLAAFGVIGLAFSLRGCGHYGTVSGLAYRHATAIYSVCNQQDLQRLELCSQEVEAAVAAAEISSQEAEWLHEIMATARNGQWTEAGAMSRQLMVDQVQH